MYCNFKTAVINSICKTLTLSGGAHMKRLLTSILFLLVGLLFSCQPATTAEPIPACEWGFTETVNEEIRILSVTAPKSTIQGSADDFANVCKPIDSHELFFKNALVKTHQVIFTFDAIYPLQDIVFTGYVGDQADTVEMVSVDLSLDGENYDRAVTDRELPSGSGVIDLSGHAAKAVRIVFAAGLGTTKGIQDVRFHLGEGYIVREATEWSEAFLRYSGWTGADGIFSFNLNGDDSIGALGPITAFYFSDTFVGTVDQNTLFRKASVMINNSLGYYDGNADIFNGLTFAYGTAGDAAQSAFHPNAYIGFIPQNLLDSDGLSATFDATATLSDEANGVMWRTAKTGSDFVQIDFGSVIPLGTVTLWNYNEHPDHGVSAVRILTSPDGSTWIPLMDVDVAKASGTSGQADAFTRSMNDVSARHVRIEILSSYDETMVGLGKLFFTDEDGEPLFGTVTASSYDDSVMGNELSSRLWLQDGIVSGDHLYIFPLLVKDDGSLFKVTRVGVIKVPITGGTIDFEHADYLASPLQSRPSTGGVLYYGAGVMDNTEIDGFVYVYGYLDKGGRHLIVARVEKDDLEDFNRWRYFDGSGWSKDINDSAPLIEGVSPELSVTRIASGMDAGKYMLVAMEGTTSGRVVYSVSDTPWGGFRDFFVLYETPESGFLRGAFTYNAKMHVHLSHPGSYLISYNVNTSQLAALNDARIYHPRFILITETKQAE